ncbi:hypothetical protein IV102_20805 [bacterium]|nr:hypothetical protein [bacterium]
MERLLEEYRSGRRTHEDVARSLDIFDMFVEQWNEGLMALPVEPEILPEGEETLEESVNGLGCFSEASGFMRDFLETGDESFAEQALEIARVGHETLEQLYLNTAKKVEQLQNEVG